MTQLLQPIQLYIFGGEYTDFGIIRDLHAFTCDDNLTTDICMTMNFL